MVKDKNNLIERSKQELKADEIFEEKFQDEDGVSRLERFRQIRADLEEIYADKLDYQQRAYLAMYAVTGKVNLSCKVAGINYYRLRAWRDGGENSYGLSYPELFKELEELHDELFNELLLEEVDRRAVEGVRKAKYYKGEVIGYERDYSDNLLMFRVKGRMPEYRENHELNIANKEGGTININFKLPDLGRRIEGGDILDVSPEDEEGDN